ncbi:Eukaryotic aspartyl protease family protein [Perilla frutescens var. frutescens]|nr:Eukaryotic aspartyl protease family protein [Perilla frutescens var. frutescens]
MVLLLILAAFICSNEVFTLGEKELLSLKRLPTVQPSPGPARTFMQKSSATILEMKHRDSSSAQKRLALDDIRVESIQTRIKTIVSSKVESSEAQIPINSGVKLQTLNYIVTATLGSRNLTVIVDTGSDLSWVQCQPCRLCYTQPEPLYNPLISPSYRSVQCNSQPCHTLQYATGNLGLCGSNAPTCNYAVTYGDGSYTRGELGSDRLTLGTTKVENFVFGCGRNNKGLFGAASGLMGLGRSDLSLISQTSDVFGGVFSYCLPDSDSGTSGSLVLGTDTSVFKNSTPFSYTALVPNPQLYSFYILNMTGASVGGVALQSSSFGENGILIDSGTVITRLPPSVYTAVKGEFLKQFTGYPSAPSFSILDTCFNLSAYEEVSIPTLRLQFEGDAEMSVDVTGMFYFVKRDASQVCLALASLAYEDEIGIIGNYQQRNTRVMYDTKQMQVGFAKEMCSFS